MLQIALLVELTLDQTSESRTLLKGIKRGCREVPAGYRDERGNYRVRWIPDEHAIGVPHDVPVLGYRVNTCDRLRLWRADASESFDFYAFNIGDYYGAVEEKVGSETLSKVLYPNDGTDEGRRLRLKQQHFFVSCSLQDMLRSLDNRGSPVHLSHCLD